MRYGVAVEHIGAHHHGDTGVALARLFDLNAPRGSGAFARQQMLRDPTRQLVGRSLTRCCFHRITLDLLSGNGRTKNHACRRVAAHSGGGRNVGPHAAVARPLADCPGENATCAVGPCAPSGNLSAGASMSYETILFEVANGAARLTLNRPDRLNSFTVQMHNEVAEALSEVEQDDSVRALLITGAGRGFCAGQDLADRAVAPGGDGVDLGESLENRYNPLIRRLVNLPKP